MNIIHIQLLPQPGSSSVSLTHSHLPSPPPGSTLLAFPGTQCTNCGAHMNPRFDPARSSTINAIPCGAARCTGPSVGCSADHICSYSQGYAEGSSLSGVLYTDHVYIGDEDGDPGGAAVHAAYTLPDFKFGVHRSEDGLFTTQLADGIMGLGTGELSIVPALWNGGMLDAYVFSLCLSVHGGALTLGAMDARLHITPVAWAAMSSAGFYGVRVTGFQLAGGVQTGGAAVGGVGAVGPIVATLDPSPFNAGETIVDSGTTFTYINTGGEWWWWGWWE